MDESGRDGLFPCEMIIIAFESGLHHLVDRYVNILPSGENGFLVGMMMMMIYYFES